MLTCRGVPELGELIMNMELPDETSYMQSLREAVDSKQICAIITYVTPSELIALKGYTQANPRTKVFSTCL